MAPSTLNLIPTEYSTPSLIETAKSGGRSVRRLSCFRDQCRFWVLTGVLLELCELGGSLGQVEHERRRERGRLEVQSLRDHLGHVESARM